MKIKNKIRSALCVVAAFSLAVAGVFSGLAEHASAAQVTARSIRISDSTPNANGVIYRVAFTVATTGNVGGIAIDFCSNTPIIGDSCTTPGAFDVNESTLTVNNQSGITGLAVDAATTANKLILTRTVGNINSGTNAVFELGDATNALHNPSATGSFYARIYTYATVAAAQGHSPGTPTGYVDYGGIAMSTAAVINITARVMETLSFCVYNTTCGDDPSITIGHTVGTTTVIDSTAVDTATVNFSLSTNANGGAAIRMKGDTLKNGSNDIDPAGAVSTFAAGTEEFGVRLSTAGTNITGTAPYDGGSGTQYGLIVTGGGSDDITSTYGGQVAALSAPVNNSISTLTFAATASTTTPAGTYTATEKLIATGIF
ncbi:MAG TPA: hypothetical protein VJ836_05905 [Candidatus Saccharimonadales bacterium]|nr:hypothetical protein [Candidatus Saccharimonadales bacterium]